MKIQTNHQERIERFMIFAGQKVPKKPKIPTLEVRKLRAELILEEAIELIAALGFGIRFDFTKGLCIQDVGRDPDLIKITDGCCDLSVVTIGTLSACGIQDAVPLALVDQNNLEKLNGYKGANGKWIKPVGHKPPDLAKELRKQGWKG